jgi:phosphocarrier protein HPr
MIQQTVELNSKAGLYARSITQLVEVASRFHSEIFLTHNGRKANLKSIMGVLSVAIPKQAEITLEFSGKDEWEALEQVMKTFQSLD